MAQQTTESKRLVSYTIAEWACALKYEDLSPEAVQAAKLFWFDSIGCALGGSQQEDARILLKHYRAMSATADSSTGESGSGGKATAFVSGFKTNPVDAAFLNGHMIRSMDYNDIYWKADPCHPSDLIAAPLALCESEGLSGQDLILATIIAYEIEMRLCEIGTAGRAGIRMAPRHLERVCRARGRRAGPQPHFRPNGFGHRDQRRANVLSGRGDGGQIDQHEKHGRSVGRTNGSGERAPGSRRIFRSRAHHRRQGRTLRRVSSCPVQRTAGHVRRRRVSQRPAQLAQVALPDSRLRNEKFPDRSAQSRAAHRHDEDG